MMQRSTIVYGVLFGAAMIAAYLSWTDDPVDERAEGVVLVDAKPDQLASVTYESKELDVTLDIREDELGRFTWVTTERRIDTAAPQNPHDPHHTMDQETTETLEGEEAKIKKAAFKAGKAGEQLLEDLAPFRVARALQVSEERMDEFGFDEPQATLTITTKSDKKHSFEIGDTAYGHRNVYIRDGDGKVYVIKRSVVSPLDRADTRLPEKELFDMPVSGVKRAVISTAGDSLEVVQRNRDDAAKAKWTAPGSDEVNTAADNWLDKVFRLRSSGYVAGEPAFETAFAVKLFAEDGDSITVEVLRGTDAEDEPTWYARSEYTRGLVKLNGNLAADAVDDLTTLFSQE